MTETPPPAARHVPWQLGIAGLALGVGVVFAFRAGEDFNRWIVTLMWFAVGIFWIVLWRRDVKRRRYLEARATAPIDRAVKPAFDPSAASTVDSPRDGDPDRGAGTA